MSSVKRRMVPVAAAAALAGAVLVSCVGPAPAPLPDPIISCQSVSGHISYNPPVTTTAADTTATIEPTAVLSGCTENTGNLITGASLAGTAVLPGFSCGTGVGPSPEGTEFGAGTGTFGWSNGSTSGLALTLRSSGTVNQFIVDVRITSGLWVGATASVLFGITFFEGDCVTVPLTGEMVRAAKPFTLHPGG
jgi:hypothetical protein